MSNYAILRFGKIKSISQLAATKGHCDRSRETLNVDPDRSHLNQQLIGDLDQLIPTVEFLLHEAEKIRKTRTDANLVCEIFMGASPEWFRNGDPLGQNDPQKEEEFAQRATEFLVKEFGENCISATFHRDETTPHIHAHFVPIHREKSHLSWADWFGDKTKMHEWQDKFAAHMESAGLQRGVKGSTATHEEIQDYYGRIVKDLEVPDVAQEFSLPEPLPSESAEDYHRRLTAHFAATAPQMQEAISTIAAHAVDRDNAQQKAKDTTLTLHALVDEVDDLGGELTQAKADLGEVKTKLKISEGAIEYVLASEMVEIGTAILNEAKKNYRKGSSYIYSRRRGVFKIDNLDGQRLVDVDKDGRAVLGPGITAEDVQLIRQEGQKMSQSIEKHIEKQEKEKQGRDQGR